MLSTLDLSYLELTIIVICALLTSVVHGATGIAGGFLMAAVLTPFLGVKAVMPVLSIALLISGSTRSLMNIRLVNWKVFFALTLPAIPAILIVGSYYGKLSGSFIAGLLGITILISIPLRRLSNKLKFNISIRGLVFAGGAYGALTGASIGPGLLLVPLLINYGLVKETFVITLSAAAVLAHITRITAYTGAEQYTFDLVFLGAAIGILSIPGNWAGRGLLRKISSDQHVFWIEVLMAFGAINFFWIALR